MSIDAEVVQIRKELATHILPTIQLAPSLERPEHPWSSKFGGLPYWPKSMSYPESDCGFKLILLAQLNFSELPELEGFPKKGLLQFFILDDGLYGADFSKPAEEVIAASSGYRVVYHSEIIEDESALETKLPVASQTKMFPLSEQYSLTGSLEKELPSATDYRFEQAASNPMEYEKEVTEYIYDHFISAGSKIGGYANFTQQDPRHGSKDEWLLLFQMDSEVIGNSHIMWGDMGIGSFFIKKEALEMKDFSKVWYSWDCG